jgi:PKD repeat protein
MRRKELMGIFGCCVLLLYASVSWAAPVPDTGQTKCYDVAGNVINCPSPGQPLYGQDANYTINPMSYTKLDGSGNALPDSATAWAMVKDNVTGLIWENKTDDGTIHDKDNTYTWYDPSDPNPGTPGDGTDTKDFIDTLNNDNFGGYNDWRLPSIKELESIVNNSISYPQPAISISYFQNTQSFFYWSSTNTSTLAWGVYFNSSGHVFSYGKSGNYYVRATRGGQSQSAFVNNGNGTITDTSTGLMWQQETPDNIMTWEEALSYCENLNLPIGVYTDWRLPTIKELRTLVDSSRRSPAINTMYFPDTVSSAYWSSTTYASYTNSAWGVGFDNNDNYTPNKGAFAYYVRAVRGGQSGSLSAKFTSTPVSGQVPLTVQFTDTSTGSPVAWAWTFGDGGTSTEQNPSHTYNAEGSYTVSLTVTNASNNQNTVTRTNLITVGGSGGCQAQKVLNSSGDGNAEKKASVLREFRDRVLAGTPAGQEMIRLYYRHDPEIKKILASESGLTADCLRAMTRAWPIVYAAIATGKGVQIPDALFNDASQVLDRVGAAGSDALKSDINKVKTFLNSRKK